MFNPEVLTLFYLPLPMISNTLDKTLIVQNIINKYVMSKHVFNLVCPNCSSNLEVERILLELPIYFKTYCLSCYYPLRFYTSDNHVEINIVEKKKTAFLIHSSNPEERTLLDWFRALLKLWGIETRIIEEDHRPVDWLQKSLDGITATDFALAFLTKRYQFLNESGNIQGWKAPDKCYEEIAISFALHKDLYALVEKEVAPGNVLATRAWCYPFKRKTSPDPTPIEADSDFFYALSEYVGS